MLIFERGFMLIMKSLINADKENADLCGLLDAD